MIPDIIEKNFPDYATLASATATIEEMGDRTITAQVKIDGAVRPSFVGTDGNMWEVEFQGDRYIQPLLEPQALKDNQSIRSVIDLTFYHWAIYQMKRYFFVSLANVQSGTPMVDKYIVPLGVSLPEFAAAFNDILNYYFPDGSIYVHNEGGSLINPNFSDYDPQRKYLEISYTYIWEVLQKTYELYDCPWFIKRDDDGNYAVWFGYPNQEHNHIFNYDAENGGLVRIERQVQDADIRNELLGRGGSKNLPYMYFKDYEQFHPNSEDSAYKNIGIPDPDAIPELENILFTELRDSNFRSYVQGWKTNANRQLSTEDGWVGTLEPYDSARGEEDWAYYKGAHDEYFDPVEYVKDDESIAKYGLLQGGLENNEEIFPSLQGMTLELPCVVSAHGGHEVETRVDEVVDVEEVTTDEIRTSGSTETSSYNEEIVSDIGTAALSVSRVYYFDSGRLIRVEFGEQNTVSCRTENIEVPEGYTGNFLVTPDIVQSYYTYQWAYKGQHQHAHSATDYVTETLTKECDANVISIEVYDAYTDRVVTGISNLPQGSYYVRAVVKPSISMIWRKTVEDETLQDGYNYRKVYYDFIPGEVRTSINVVCSFYKFAGEIIPNTDGVNPVSGSITINKGASGTISLVGSTFTVPESGALFVDVPMNFSPKEFATFEKTVKIIDEDSHEVIENSSIPAGTYQLTVEVKITNNGTDQNSREFTASMLPSFLYYNLDSDEWRPTFDIWIKNVFDTNRGDYSTDDLYVAGVWGPLISTQEMTVTFATGNLSSYSDWEFKVAKDGIHYDNSKSIIIEDENGVKHEIRSEWRLTLIKSDAEADAIHKYVPYKDFNAVPGDLFYFTNIYLPWAYVFAAEKYLNEYKTAELGKTKEIDPAWVVGLHKIWASKYGEGNIAENYTPGDKIWIKDKRFTPDTGLQMIIKSISFSWGENPETGIGLNDVEFVLSNKVETSLSTIQRITSDVKELSEKVNSFSNLERQIRRVGDAVYLRKDGFEDTTYSPTNVATSFRSQNYRTGLVGGEGWTIDLDDEGNSLLEIDRLNVRKEMNVGTLVVNQISARGGREILSAASIVITNVEPVTVDDDVAFKCYFDTKSGTLANMFVTNDIALSQVFDSNNILTKYYRSLVVDTGQNYVILSGVTKDGDGEPSVGDVLVQYGNTVSTARQNVIIRDAIGDGRQVMLRGLNSVSSTGEEYYFSGAQSGSPRWYVGDSNHYAKYENGELEIQAKVKILSGSEGADNILPWVQTDTSGGVTTVAGGAVLSKVIGVEHDGEMIAGINSTDNWDDPDYGKLTFFSGTSNTVTPDAAAYRAYEDGTVILNKLIANNADVSGKITSGSGQIGGFKISSSNLVSSSGSTSMTLSREVLGFSDSDATVLLGQNVMPATSSGIASLRIDSNHPVDAPDGLENIGAYISVTGANRTNSAIYVPNGMISGLRPKTRLISGTVNLDKYDYNVIVNSASTINLPSNPQEGQTLMIIVPRYYAVTINGNGKQIYRIKGNSPTTSSSQTHSSFAGIDYFVYDSNVGMWIMVPLEPST